METDSNRDTKKLLGVIEMCVLELCLCLLEYCATGILVNFINVNESFIKISFFQSKSKLTQQTGNREEFPQPGRRTL